MNKQKLLTKLKSESKRLVNTYYLLIAIPFIIIIFMFFTISNKTAPQYFAEPKSMININKGWSNKDGKKITINPFNNNKDIKKGETYTLYHNIPEKTQVGDTLCFRGLSTDINIYIGNKHIIDTPYKKNLFSCKSPGNVWYFYTFKKDDLGKTLKMTITPCYDDTSCYIDDMYIGNSTTYIKNFFAENLAPLLIALLILLLGVIYFIIGIYTCIRQKTFSHNLLYIGTFSILIALCSALATHVGDFIPGLSQPIQFMSIMLLYIIPGGALLFVKSTFSKESKDFTLINITLILTFILYGLAMLLQLTGISDLHETLYLSHICIISNCTAIIITLLLAYKNNLKQYNRQKDKTKNNNIPRTGNIVLPTIIFLVMILCFIADILIFYSNSNSSIGIFTRIASLIIVIYLGMLAIQNLYDMEKDASHAKFVHKLAYSDGLTGVSNRTSFKEKLAYLEENINEYNTIGFISFDVNNLKTVNDTLGHALGDDLIISASNIIKQSFEEFATVYRIGGDEFVAIIEGNNAEEICKMCSLQFNVNIQNFNNFYSKPYKMSIAHGSSFYNKDLQQSIKETLEESDNKMYKNKQEIKKNGL